MGVSYPGGGGGDPGAAIQIPFVAGDFFATGGMAWTVDPGDVNTWAYVLEGKKLTLWLRTRNTTIVAPVAGNNLQLKLPNGMKAAMETVQLWFAAPGGAPSEQVLIATTVGSNVCTILRDNANWVAGVNNTDVGGVLTIMVQ
jgi:hypothetical protein